MNKLLSILLVLLLLCGCQNNDKNNDKNEKYINLFDTLSERTVFVSSSSSFDINCDIATTNDGYRYYVIIDNPKNAMYGVEAIAIEKGTDYSNTMAANVGIFEDIEYNLLPGQANVDKGYVSGLSISGVTNIDNPTLRILVQWHSKKQEIHQEFFEINIDFKENNE